MPSATVTQVIKIGTSSLVNFAKKSFNIGALAQLCEAVRNLKDQGVYSPMQLSGSHT